MLSSVLIFGHDTTLLGTRALILGRDGFQVLTTTDAAETNHILARQSVDLLILCHTLSEQERRTALALARAAHPPLRALALVANATRYTAEGPEVTLSTLDGPRTFLAAVHELIEPHQPVPRA
ncbi:MAG TPA: hypothetical protein VHY48_11130 [Acidobacteriaceae bacterium]|nr:hypothetical protein [Acidobacteriaceae bacterium]